MTSTIKREASYDANRGKKKICQSAPIIHPKDMLLLSLQAYQIWSRTLVIQNKGTNLCQDYLVLDLGILGKGRHGPWCLTIGHLFQ